MAQLEIFIEGSDSYSKQPMKRKNEEGKTVDHYCKKSEHQKKGYWKETLEDAGIAETKELEEPRKESSARKYLVNG